MSTTIERGLEDVVIAKSGITFIDGEQGILRYRGIDIKDLAARSSYEEVVYLLWHGKLPTKSELASFTSQLSKQRPLRPEVLSLLRKMPKNANPMEVARTAASYIATFPRLKGESFEEANNRKALELTANLGTIVATYDRIRNGKSVLSPDPKLGHAGNFLYLLRGKRPDEDAVSAFDTICILYADHEMNASTFAACVTASTLADLGGAVTSAIATLAGPLHGGSNQRVTEMLEEIGSVANAEKFIDDELGAGRRIMGFGHRIYKTYDPRAAVLKQVAENLAKDSESRKWLEVAQKIEQAVWDRKKLYPNIEFYAAVVLNALGIEKDVMPAVFACNRIAGWVAHLFEQYADNRLIRPLTEYSGPPPRLYVPIEQRS